MEFELISLVPFERIREWEVFDVDLGKGIDVEIREYFIPDFSEWQVDEEFEEAFSRLLTSLRLGDKDD